MCIANNLRNIFIKIVLSIKDRLLVLIRRIDASSDQQQIPEQRHR